MASSVGQPSWKSPFVNQQTLETKTFTWRLRPHMVSNHSSVPSNPSITKSTPSTPGSRPTTSSSHAASRSSSGLSMTNPHQTSEEKFLRFQEFEIEAGQSLGLHSAWSLFIVSCGAAQQHVHNMTSVPSSSDSDFIGLFLQKIFSPTKQQQSVYLLPEVNDEEIFVRYKAEIMDREGEVLYTKECETVAKEKLEVGYWDWKKIVPVAKFHCCGKSPRGKPGSRVADDATTPDESILLLRITFTIVNRRKDMGKARLPPSAQKALTSEEDSSTREAANEFLNLITNSKSLEPDLVIEITSRRKFLVHKKMLVGRSSVFLKMLASEMNEKCKGVIKVEDISAHTMELVLKHIYTGQLEEDWTMNPVTATELVYASEKYWLPGLKEFCNKHLVRGATKSNCYKLMEVAQLHNLDKATDDLMAFASEGLSSNNNSRKSSEESVELKT